eukprot:gnl/TRDRNA2_/TRDRNA2_177203_c1_seq9.p1 gnl/TRDRNA2_/TRDRNA2_177203_c1~~gnl/TRDRNA2_/TRDRNA2_177203_c1_seq9.p1  ORF type:complete len:431 (+),score=89.94 gnl/TRDRNA2_/TRDRNA2_177203_c1_seq9:187-1293(+)
MANNMAQPKNMEQVVSTLKKIDAILADAKVSQPSCAEQMAVMERQMPYQMNDVAAGPELLKKIDSQRRTAAAEEVMQSGKEESTMTAGLNTAFADAFGQLGMGFAELVQFASTIPDITPTDDPILLPVSALRFTHHTVNANFAFGDDHNNSQESIFKLFLNLFWGRVLPEEMDPLYVFLHTAPDGNVGLYTRNNRRLLALRMLQAVQQGKLLRVPCKVFRSDDRRPAPVDGKSLAKWFAEGYDAPGSRKGCDGFGFSIWPRADGATHGGHPTLDPANTALLAIKVLVLLKAGVKATKEDEETLTFCSDAAVPARSGRQATSDRGKGNGKARAKGGLGSLPHRASFSSECCFEVSCMQAVTTKLLHVFG